MKKLACAALALISIFMLTGCAGQTGGAHVEGTLTELMEQVYSGSGVTEWPSLVTTAIDESNVQYYLGTPDIELTEGLASEPMINAIAHSVCLIRVPSDADVEKVKADIKENADPRKWICVCVDESDVIVDSIGDLVILIMADEAQALHESFLALAGSN